MVAVGMVISAVLRCRRSGNDTRPMKRCKWPIDWVRHKLDITPVPRNRPFVAKAQPRGSYSSMSCPVAADLPSCSKSPPIRPLDIALRLQMHRPIDYVIASNTRMLFVMTAKDQTSISALAMPSPSQTVFHSTARLKPAGRYPISI